MIHGDLGQVGCYEYFMTYLFFLCNSETLSGADDVKENTEDFHDLPGAVKIRTLLDYNSYMTQLIGTESCDPTPSPCHSDTGSPTPHKKVKEQNLYLSFSCGIISIVTWQHSMCDSI